MSLQIVGTDEEIGKACWEERRKVDALLNDGAPCAPLPLWEELSVRSRMSWYALAPKIRDGRLTISEAAGGKT